MQRPLQITFHEIPRSDALEAHIREKVEKLESFYPHMIGCRVTVGLEQKHKQQGKLHNVRIDTTVPGGEVVINRETHEDIYVALRDAFDAAKRKLEDYARRQRGDIKVHEPVSYGRIARIFPEEGFGFIETPGGSEVYFHRENVVHPDFAQLKPGTEVQFLEVMGNDGLQARRVSAGKHHAPQ